MAQQDVAAEIEKLSLLYDNDPRGLMALLSGQLSVLKSQAQMLMGLSGLCITVTGFSGHNMVKSGPIGAISMSLGIGLILVGVLFALRTMTATRWVSEDLDADLGVFLERVIPRRNTQQSQMRFAFIFVGVGFAFYVLSVIYSAFALGQWTPP